MDETKLTYSEAKMLFDQFMKAYKAGRNSNE